MRPSTAAAGERSLIPVLGRQAERRHAQHNGLFPVTCEPVDGCALREMLRQAHLLRESAADGLKQIGYIRHSPPPGPSVRFAGAIIPLRRSAPAQNIVLTIARGVLALAWADHRTDGKTPSIFNDMSFLRVAQQSVQHVSAGGSIDIIGERFRRRGPAVATLATPARPRAWRSRL